MAFKVLCVDHVGVAVKDLALIKQQMKDILGLDPSLPDETVEDQHVTTSFFKPSPQTEACELEFLGSTTPDGPIARFIEKSNGGKNGFHVGDENSHTTIRPPGRTTRSISRSAPTVSTTVTSGAAARQLPSGVKRVAPLAPSV